MGPGSSTKLIPLAALLVAIGLAASGCGGGGDGGTKSTGNGSTGSTQPTNKPRFIERAEAVCKSLSGQIDAAAAQLSKAKSGQDQAKALGAEIPLVSQELRRLEAIPPPKNGSAPKKVLDLKTQALGEFRRAQRSAQKGDARRTTAHLKKQQQLNAQAQKLAKGYGLKTCSQH